MPNITVYLGAFLATLFLIQILRRPAAQIGLVVVLLGFYLRQWPRVWVRGGWHTFRFIQVAAGISLLLLMLHSLVDFNLHIPANAVYFAFLAAVFMHRHREEEAPHRHEPSPVPEKIEPQLLPPQNVVNPFAQ